MTIEKAGKAWYSANDFGLLFGGLPTYHPCMAGVNGAVGACFSAWFIKEFATIINQD